MLVLFASTGRTSTSPLISQFSRRYAAAIVQIFDENWNKASYAGSLDSRSTKPAAERDSRLSLGVSEPRLADVDLSGDSCSNSRLNIQSGPVEPGLNGSCREGKEGGARRGRQAAIMRAQTVTVRLKGDLEWSNGVFIPAVQC